MRAAANPDFDRYGDPDVMSLREVRVPEPLHGSVLDPRISYQNRWAEAALHPLHRELTSEVGGVGRPHKGTLVRAGYPVGGCAYAGVNPSDSNSSEAKSSFSGQAILSSPRATFRLRNSGKVENHYLIMFSPVRGGF
jgi:hypothetical protein